MSDHPKDPNDTPLPPKDWPRWFREVCTAVEDLEAVTKDRIRRKRNRDLGIREAKRLYRDASDKLAKLLGRAGGGGGDDGGDDERRGDPAGLGGSPAH